ncbi:hypothetical protein PO909_029372 [Leuciscus waleckii]
MHVPILMFQINAEFKRITTMPLQSRFLSQLDLFTANLLKVFEKRSGQQGKKLRDMSVIVTVRILTIILSVAFFPMLGLGWQSNCVLSFHQEMAETHFFSAIEMTTVGIYVVKDTANSEPSDVRIVIEGVVALRDLENVALASAMLFGLFYALNMQYPTKLPYTAPLHF